MEYRVIYKVNASINESTQYYNVFHSSEALDFLAHTLRSGHIHGKNLRILKVEEFNTYRREWEDRTLKAIEHCKAPELSQEDDITWLRL